MKLNCIWCTFLPYQYLTCDEIVLWPLLWERVSYSRVWVFFPQMATWWSKKSMLPCCPRTPWILMNCSSKRRGNWNQSDGGGGGAGGRKMLHWYMAIAGFPFHTANLTLTDQLPKLAQRNLKHKVMGVGGEGREGGLLQCINNCCMLTCLWSLPQFFWWTCGPQQNQTHKWWWFWNC